MFPRVRLQGHLTKRRIAAVIWALVQLHRTPKHCLALPLDAVLLLLWQHDLQTETSCITLTRERKRIFQFADRRSPVGFLSTIHCLFCCFMAVCASVAKNTKQRARCLIPHMLPSRWCFLIRLLFTAGRQSLESA